MINLHIILAILASVIASTHITGNFFDDKSYWIASDIFTIIACYVIVAALIVTRKKEK